MSVTMAKYDGVTVFTLTSDPNSFWPPMCQILKSLCYSPMCCSVSQHLKRVQKTSQSLLGALHIMIGLLNISLGAILCASTTTEKIIRELFPYWLGGMFIFFGAMCILSEKCPSPCLVIINGILNVVGVGVAIAAIVLYSTNINLIALWWKCGYDSRYNTPAPYSDKCLEVKALILMILKGINAVLIVLSVLELCVAVSSVVLGIKAFRSSLKEENKRTDDPECYKTLLVDVTTQPTD